MPATATQMIDHFPLAHFERALDGFQPPAEAFDPQGAWVNAYDIWECSQGNRKIGALRIERTPLDARWARLAVRYRKLAAGGILRAEASIECKADDLATPIRWQAQSCVHDAEDKPIEDTRLEETGEAGERALRVKVGEKAIRIPAERPFTFDWCLFEAVQRLPGEALEPLEFTLIDRLGREAKPEQRLAFRTAATVELGGKRVWREEKHPLEAGAVYRPVPAREGATATALRAYNQTGRGIVPIVYWVNEQGRLLFALSGLIGYVLNAEAQA
ncbi:MAG: hypothetical protein FJX75_24680 [Armatimonadetes bacterium]|nr:hypothetical protein [Armatimonadota bacterium]